MSKDVQKPENRNGTRWSTMKTGRVANTCHWILKIYSAKLSDGGGVEVCGTEMLVEPLTTARGMSVVMQSTTIEAVTKRLGSQQAPGDKQGHFGCAH
jgi:hypothetical protein